MEKLYRTRRENKSFPGWANFAPFLQRYVALTGNRRAKAAMAQWADSGDGSESGYLTSINIYAHAYLYSGRADYLGVAARRVGSLIDHVYRGEIRRHYGLFLNGNSTLAESYFMQEAPYYLAALARYGRKPEPLPMPPRTTLQGYQKLRLDGQPLYALRVRIRQDADRAFDLNIRVPSLGRRKFHWIVILQPGNGGPAIRKDFSAEGTGDQAGGVASARLPLAVPADGALEYELSIYCDRGFTVRVPVTEGQDDLKEAYATSTCRALSPGGRFYFRVPGNAEQMTFRFRSTGGGAPTRLTILDSEGKVRAEDFWMGEDATQREVKFSIAGAGGAVWSFGIVGGERIDPGVRSLDPPRRGYDLHYATSPDKLFIPRP